MVEEYHAAHEHYVKQERVKAQACFKALEEQEANKLLYTVYLERIENLRNQELPADWDGTFRHTAK
ncbi:hypothetical protein N8303_02870 [Gammaproteobacteria bacterium]|nr:hypothetical protein [Gammaproteobacteria bacterium]